MMIVCITSTRTAGARQATPEGGTPAPSPGPLPAEDRPSARKKSEARDQQRIADGVCLQCGLPRGDDGTKRRCRACADVDNSGRAVRRGAGLAVRERKMFDCE